jgi:methionyl-tRNA formyltransferase
MKIAFCTCVQIGLSCIEAILEDQGRFDLLLTLPDEKAKQKSGRIYLDKIAEKFDTPLVKINHINDATAINYLKKYKIDWLFIIGWSQIASSEVLRAVNKGVIGAHPTLLPEGRGRAAIPWAILKELPKTGVTFFKMDEGVDTGEILDQYEIPLSDNITATDLYDKVNEAHVSLIKQIWPKIFHDTIIGQKQNELNASYWEGRKPEDGELNPSMTIKEVDKLVRATTKPYPGAYIIENGVKLVIWKGSLNKEKNALMLTFFDGDYYVTEYEKIEI